MRQGSPPRGETGDPRPPGGQGEEVAPQDAASSSGVAGRQGRPPADEQVAELVPVLEALIFAAEEPVTLDEIGRVLPDGKRSMAGPALERLLRAYEEEGKGLRIIQVAGGYRMVTRGAHDPYIRALHRHRNRRRLGRAALESLAIVAYRQPITAPEIAEIRRKDSTGVLKNLLEKRLIRIAGRKRVVGKPFLYGTTRHFLMHFGLNSLEDLPDIAEFDGMLEAPAPERRGSEEVPPGGEEDLELLGAEE